MINNLEIKINLKLIGVSDNRLLELINNMRLTDTGSISFEELNKILHISSRKYVVSEVDMPTLERESFNIKTTRIEIEG
jgi:hypothetical protein